MIASLSTRLRLEYSCFRMVVCAGWLTPNAHAQMHCASAVGRCHSGLVPPRHCSGGTNLLAYLFPRNMSASGSVPPGTVARPRKRSGSRKCSVWLNVVDARSGFMKTVQISLRMLLWTDSLCGAAEIVLCTYRILFYIDDLYFLSCRTLYTAVDNETLLGLHEV